MDSGKMGTTGIDERYYDYKRGGGMIALYGALIRPNEKR